MSALFVDVVSDIVCPWCYVGVKSFLAARDALQGDYEIVARFRAYQLNPDLPAGGVDRHAYYRRKFPDEARLAAARDAIRANARESGFDFDPSAPAHLPNTLKAHQLITLAHRSGRQEAVALALYRAFWDDLADIASEQTLIEIGEREGLAREAIVEALGSTGAAVLAEADAFRRAGVSGVPTFIVGERTGFSGGMPPQSMIAALREAARRNEGAAA
ncbi:MAG: DsbA family oxidoreductase [Parvularculaceae bacterium]|nr:DsbA family oxidoreductase [Parvularculaceae bacterium]